MAPKDNTRALVFAPDHETWVKSELAGTGLTVDIASSIRDVVYALIDEPPPRAQILIIDFSAITAGELLHLHSIREQGWFGNVIAIGRIPASLRKSMNVERSVLVGPYKLRPVAALAGQHTVHTMRMPKING